MLKKTFNTILYIFFFLHSFAQKTTGFTIKEIKGHFIWEMRHDSLLNVYYSKAIYLDIEDNHFSILGLGTMSAVVKICKNRQLKARYKRSLRLKRTNSLDSYYHNYTDTSTLTSSGHISMDGKFYEDKKGALFLGYKIHAKILVLDTLCSELENSKSLGSHCGSVINRPYAYVMKTIATEVINAKDLEKFGWSISSLNQIHWVECH